MTDSERYLARLCRQSFLSLWSYPNLFRDQGKSQSGDGKELTDLLVVCGNDVVVFSDKSCKYPDSGTADVDWRRWFTRALRKSADQLYGAQRWLRQHPTRVFLDRSCTKPFPLSLASENLRFHLIAVALGASDRCRCEFGGSGSLAIDPMLVGDAHIRPSSLYYRRFTVGQLADGAPFVHVFDDISLTTVLNQLNTVSDFLRYLRRKESLIASGRLWGAASEQDLLATYLSNISEDEEHDFVSAWMIEPISIGPGAWNGLLRQSEYQNSLIANRPSYLWDAMIEEIVKHVVGGTLVAGADQPLKNHELALRTMALEDRLSRRVLSKAMIEKMKNTPVDKIGMRTIMSRRPERTAYVFIVFPAHRGGDEAAYRAWRRAYLADYVFVAASKSSDVSTFVGIATETDLQSKGKSHDLVYFEPGPWTEEAKQEAARVQEARHFFKPSMSMVHMNDEEYPTEL